MFTQKYGALIVGGLLLLFGIIGVLGSTSLRIKCKRAFLLIFHISLISFSVVFIVLSTIMLLEAKKYFQQECESTSQFKELSDGVKKADQLFCSLGCPCNLDPKKFTDKSVLIGKVGFQSSALPTQVQGCQLFDSEEYAMFSQLMKILEQDFECSGWCTKTQIFIFTDVNRGNTNGISCFTRFQKYYETYITTVGYVSLGLGILFGISSFLIFCLYCYFGNEEKLKQFKKQQEMLLRQ